MVALRRPRRPQFALPTTGSRRPSPRTPCTSSPAGARREHGGDQAPVGTKVWTANDREAEHQIQNALNFFDGRVELYQVHNLVAVEKRLDMLEETKGEGKGRPPGGHRPT